MKYSRFKEELRGNCRRCINNKLGIHFKHKDCEYWDFPETCACCGKTRNIVTGIKFAKRFKLWFRKASKKQEDTSTRTDA